MFSFIAIDANAKLIMVLIPSLHNRNIMKCWGMRRLCWLKFWSGTQCSYQVHRHRMWRAKTVGVIEMRLSLTCSNLGYLPRWLIRQSSADGNFNPAQTRSKTKSIHSISVNQTKFIVPNMRWIGAHSMMFKCLSVCNAQCVYLLDTISNYFDCIFQNSNWVNAR